MKSNGRLHALLGAAHFAGLHAVHVEDVFGAAGAVDGNAAGHRFVVDAGNGGDQGAEIAPLGQTVEQLLGQGHALGGALDVDQR